MAHSTYKEWSIFDKLLKFWYFSLAWCRHNCFVIVATHLFFSFMMLYSPPNFLIIKTPSPLFLSTYFQKKWLCLSVFYVGRNILKGFLVLSSQERMVSLQPTNVPVSVYNSILNIIYFYIVHWKYCRETLNLLFEYNSQLAECLKILIKLNFHHWLLIKKVICTRKTNYCSDYAIYK